MQCNNNFINDFKEKSYLFNEFFSKEGTPLANDSALPPLLETPNETVFPLLKLQLVILAKLSKQ